MLQKTTNLVCFQFVFYGNNCTSLCLNIHTRKGLSNGCSFSDFYSYQNSKFTVCWIKWRGKMWFWANVSSFFCLYDFTALFRQSSVDIIYLISQKGQLKDISRQQLLGVELFYRFSHKYKEMLYRTEVFSLCSFPLRHESHVRDFCLSTTKTLSVLWCLRRGKKP